jgi:hypothetical protein
MGKKGTGSIGCYSKTISKHNFSMCDREIKKYEKNYKQQVKSEKFINSLMSMSKEAFQLYTDMFILKK